LHRLLAAFVRRVVSDPEAQPAVEQALLGTVGDLLDAGYPEPLVALLPHLRAVTDAAKEREDERAAFLCNRLGACLRMTGAYTEARPLYERALAITEKVLGEDHPDTASTLNNLAALLSDQGSYEEARPLYERVLAITEKVLGEDHPYTKRVRQNLTTLNILSRGRQVSVSSVGCLPVRALDNGKALIGVEARPAPPSDRRLVSVRLVFRDRHTQIVERYSCTIDVTGEFCFLGAPLSPTYD
jgi:tetratricopeptide (TPR) repeat protein